MSLLYFPVSKLEGHRSAITVMTFNSSGSLLASGDEDGVVIVWTVSSGTITSIITPMDAVTTLHFTTATSEEDETIAVGTKGGLLVGYKISKQDSGYNNTREIYCAKYSDYPLVAITSVASFILVVSGIQPSFHHAGQFCLRLYTLDGPREPSLKLDPIWKRRMSGGQPKMANMYIEENLEMPTIDLWLHSGVQLRFRQNNSSPVEWKIIRDLESEIVSIDVHSNRTLISLALGATELHTDNDTSYRTLSALRVPLGASDNRVEFRNRSVIHCIFIEDGTRALCGTVDGKLMIYDLDDDQTSISPSQVLCHGDQDVATVPEKLRSLAASSDFNRRVHMIVKASMSALPSIELWTRSYSENEQIVAKKIGSEQGQGSDNIGDRESGMESSGVDGSTSESRNGVDEYPESSEEEPDDEEESMRRIMMQRVTRVFYHQVASHADAPTVSTTNVALSAQLSLLFV